MVTNYYTAFGMRKIHAKNQYVNNNIIAVVYEFSGHGGQ